MKYQENSTVIKAAANSASMASAKKTGLLGKSMFVLYFT